MIVMNRNLEEHSKLVEITIEKIHTAISEQNIAKEQQDDLIDLICEESNINQNIIKKVMFGRIV